MTDIYFWSYIKATFTDSIFEFPSFAESFKTLAVGNPSDVDRVLDVMSRLSDKVYAEKDEQNWEPAKKLCLSYCQSAWDNLPGMCYAKN